MPGHDDLRERLKRRAASLDSGTHVDYLAQALATEFEHFAPTDTGTLSKNLTVVFDGKKIGPGVWQAGVGDKKMIGSPSDKAPRGTISQFLKEVGGPEYNFWPGRQKVNSRYAWWALPSFLKERLQAERLAGRFGGETGVGAGRSPYMYSQDRGNANAGITGQRFISMAFVVWRAVRSQYIRAVMGG